jgi:hypothetical protein
MASYRSSHLNRFLFFFGILSYSAFVPFPSLCQQTPAPGTCFVYPSPATSNNVTVVYNMPQGGTAQVLVYNEAGDLVVQVQESKPAGLQQTSLDLYYYRNGIYLCQVLLTFEGGGGQRLNLFKFMVVK